MQLKKAFETDLKYFFESLTNEEVLIAFASSPTRHRAGGGQVPLSPRPRSPVAPVGSLPARPVRRGLSRVAGAAGPVRGQHRRAQYVAAAEGPPVWSGMGAAGELAQHVAAAEGPCVCGRDRHMAKTQYLVGIGTVEIRCSIGIGTVELRCWVEIGMLVTRTSVLGRDT